MQQTDYKDSGIQMSAFLLELQSLRGQEGTTVVSLQSPIYSCSKALCS